MTPTLLFLCMYKYRPVEKIIQKTYDHSTYLDCVNQEMDKLVNLTQADIDNGALIRLLTYAGIPDVQEYVRKFHRQTEDLILDDLKQPDSTEVDNYEHIASPTDVERWIADLRSHWHHLTHKLSSKHRHQVQHQRAETVQNLIKDLHPDLHYTPPVGAIEHRQMPTDLHSWLTTIRPNLEEPSQPPRQEQQPRKPQPKDLVSWMQGMAPVHLQSSTDITPADPIDPDPVAGNLGTWLTDWSRNLAQQPPPTSLDTWLKGLVSDNLHEPIGKAASSKGRLNSYLNAAQQVLSEHGYNVPNQSIPTNNVETKTGVFSNVKQMYFLVSSLVI